MRSGTLLTLVVVLGVLAACSQEPGTADAPSDGSPPEPPPPEFVHLRGDDVQVEVIIKAPIEAKVGTWYTLSASRRITGSWPRVPWSDELMERDWLGVPPENFQAEVAANLDWFTRPSGVAEFDCCGIVEGDPWKRQIRFKEPGLVRLHAVSAHPIQGTSNVLTIRVSE